jgi:hypothetical protein
LIVFLQNLIQAAEEKYHAAWVEKRDAWVRAKTAEVVAKKSEIEKGLAGYVAAQSLRLHAVNGMLSHLHSWGTTKQEAPTPTATTETTPAAVIPAVVVEESEVNVNVG